MIKTFGFSDADCFTIHEIEIPRKHVWVSSQV